MSREIKFRGFQPELKKWLYGDLIQVPNWSSFIFEWSGNFEDRVQVSSDSVGQYTGHKDKNGVEIYEGDIVIGAAITLDAGHQVTFKNGSFMWRGEPLAWDLDDSGGTLCLPEGWAKVIGNIHQNPELLANRTA